MSSQKSSPSYQEIQTMLAVYAQTANQWARFSQGQTPINAVSFVQSLVLGWLKQKDASLNQLAQAGGDLGLTISGAALHERMDQSAVVLLAGVLKLALEAWRKPCPLALKSLQRFSGIYLIDSTQIALPPSLASVFRGNMTNSMVKVQVVWDYLNGNLAALELEAGRTPDQKCRLSVTSAQAGSLQLFDLGYFKQEYVQAIDQQKAYFVSRYQSQTALYHAESQVRFDMVAWLKGLKTALAECQVLLGERVKLSVRMVVRHLSPTAAAARRRQARQKAKEQGKTCSAAYLFLLGWDVLLTNLGQEWDACQIFHLYAIRFQIEWVFRIWKSQLGIDAIGPWRVERVLCYLYAHFVAALLTHRLTAGWRWADCEYSFAKQVQIIQAAVPGLMHCLRRVGWGFAAWLKRLEADFRRFGCKTKRRKSPSTAQVIHHWDLS